MSKKQTQRNNDIYSAYRAEESIYSIAKRLSLSWTRVAQIIKEMTPKEDRLLIVYRATNKINGLKYIGSTTRPLPCRMVEHVNSPTSPLSDAFRKHGFDAFAWEIVEICSDQEEMSDREVFWINQEKTNHPDFGYNKTSYRRGTRKTLDIFEESPNIRNQKKVVFEDDELFLEEVKEFAYNSGLNTISAVIRLSLREFLAEHK